MTGHFVATCVLRREELSDVFTFNTPRLLLDYGT